MLVLMRHPPSTGAIVDRPLTSPAAGGDTRPPRSIATNRRLLEVSQAAHRLKACDEFVRRLLREGKLAGIRLGKRWRVDPVDLEAFIEANRIRSDRRGNALQRVAGGDLR